MLTGNNVKERIAALLAASGLTHERLALAVGVKREDAVEAVRAALVKAAKPEEAK